MRYIINFLLFIIMISFVSCGYKPSSKYARNSVGETLSTSVVISMQDPQNTVLLKDAIDRAIIEVFQASIRPRKEAQTHLDIQLKSIKYKPIAFSTNGFVIAYRTTILLQIDRITNKKHQLYLTSGTYDFSVVINAVVTDNQRYEAIKNSSKKAIASFISKITSQGIR